jgi:hypothetical protein
MRVPVMGGQKSTHRPLDSNRDIHTAAGMRSPMKGVRSMVTMRRRKAYIGPTTYRPQFDESSQKCDTRFTKLTGNGHSSLSEDKEEESTRDELVQHSVSELAVSSSASYI